MDKKRTKTTEEALQEATDLIPLEDLLPTFAEKTAEGVRGLALGIVRAAQLRPDIRDRDISPEEFQHIKTLAYACEADRPDKSAIARMREAFIGLDAMYAHLQAHMAAISKQKRYPNPLEK